MKTITVEKVQRASVVVPDHLPSIRPDIWPCLEDRFEDSPRVPSAVEKALVWLARKIVHVIVAVLNALGEIVLAISEHPFVRSTARGLAAFVKGIFVVAGNLLMIPLVGIAAAAVLIGVPVALFHGAGKLVEFLFHLIF